jgi:hypothetical protein
MDRLTKVHAIDGRGDACRTRMADGRDRCGTVQHREHDTTKDMPEIVGITRHHDLR